MLREHFIASIGASSKSSDTSAAKDAAIFVHEFQPLAAQRTVFKQSATPPACLVASEDHIFAAQAAKAAVHVYDRETGKQELIVPFPERISALSLACHDSVVILGTAEGRIFLWETCTGRQITTSQAHLQAVTAVCVDPTGNILLSASKDSTVQVWSIPDLLSFANSTSQSLPPRHTFNSHRSEVTALQVGRGSISANFAISTSKDRTCLLWDYRKNNLLRTYLLSGIPNCIALDPADRAAYIGCEEGNVQMLDLLASSTSNPQAVHDARAGAGPIQPGSTSQWKPPDHSHGAIRSIDITFDGTSLLSGHESGSVLNWDVARRRFSSMQILTPLPGPVTNLSFLPVTGFHQKRSQSPIFRVNKIVKPKFGAFDSSDSGLVPASYAFHVQFPSNIHGEDHHAMSMDFDDVLTASVFPADLLDEGLHELATWDQASKIHSDKPDEETADFMALDTTPQPTPLPSPESENAHLKLQLEALRRVQARSFDRIEELRREKAALKQQIMGNSTVNKTS